MSDAPVRGHARDAAWVSVGIAVSRGLALCTAIVASHILQVDELAAYLVTVAASLILIPISDAGCWQLVARTASRNTDAPLFALTMAANRARLPLWLALLTGTLVWALATGSTPLLVAACAVASAVAQVNLDAMSSELFSRGSFPHGAAVQVVPAAIGLIGTGLLALGSSPTMEGAFLVFTAARVLPVLALLLAFRPRPERRAAITLRAALPFAGTTIALVAYSRSDAVLLGAFDITPVAVAAYILAYNVVNAMLVIPSAIAMSLYPRIAGGDESDVRKHGLAQTGFAIAVALALGVGVIAFVAPSAVLMVFGGDLTSRASEIAPLFLLIVPVTGAQVLLSALQGLDDEHGTLRIVAGVGVLNVAAHLVLIPAFGVRGAIAASVGGAILLTILLLARTSAARLRGSDVVGVGLVLACPALAATGAPVWATLALAGAALIALWWLDVFGVRRVVRQSRPHVATAK